jgi:thioredoxin 1
MTVAKVDVDDNRALAERFKIQSIPTLILFKDGKAVDMKIGALPASWSSGWKPSWAEVEVID